MHFQLICKSLYILDSVRSMAWPYYIENKKSRGLHNLVLKSSWVFFEYDFKVKKEILITLRASLMLVFSIWFKSSKNCCNKNRETPSWFFLSLAWLYFLRKDENLVATLIHALSVSNSSPILSLKPDGKIVLYTCIQYTSLAFKIGLVEIHSIPTLFFQVLQ